MNQNREKTIIRVSLTGIAVNLFLAGIKAFLGWISHSSSILSDAVNNLTDSSSSIITIIGTKLAQKKPDAAHPFGYGRIEYLTSLIIGVLVLVSGIEVSIDSIRHIFHPEQLSYSALTLAILAISVGTKAVLGFYTRKKGEQADSKALIASGKDALNDSMISALTIVSALVFLFFHVNIDAWAGLIISVMVIKTGYDTLKDTISLILGQKPDPKLVQQLYTEVKACPVVKGAYDMILNNYGPGSYIGSVNLEVDSSKTIGKLYPILHQLQTEIHHKYQVLLVFGLYAVNHSPVSQKVWSLLEQFENTHPGVINFHGIVIDEKHHQIFFDLTSSFSVDRHKMKEDALAMMEKKFPEYEIHITMDTEFSSEESE